MDKRSLKLLWTLYSDDYCTVFNKPSGLLVIPTPKKEKDTLSHLVNQRTNALTNGAKLHPCHRLDRDTSGAILFARGKKYQKIMMDQFKSLKIKKKYIALIHGRLKKRKGEIRSVIRTLEERKFNKFGRGKIAVTRYQVLQEMKNFSVVAVEPVTGRTNQIRIHFSQQGCPILGDRKYGVGRLFKVKTKRVMLHSRVIEWKHPIEHSRVRVFCDLPDDFRELIDLS